MVKEKKVFSIEGMHCASCEVLIQKELATTKGIEHAKVSLREQKVELVGENITSEKLNSIFQTLGYRFKHFTPEQKKEKTIYLLPLTGSLLVVLVFILLERSELFGLSLVSNSSLFTYFIFGLIAGISTCSALVGGLLLSAVNRWQTDFGKSPIPHMLFILGRLVSFLVLGGLLGMLGSLIAVSIRSTAMITALVSLIMLYIGCQMIGFNFAKRYLGIPKLAGVITKLESKRGKHIAFLLGALTFFVPCGFTLVAQTNALASGTFITAGTRLGAFALGTIPPLMLISATSIKLYTNSLRSRQFSIFSGFLLVFLGLLTLNSQLNVLGLPSVSDIARVSLPNTTKETGINQIPGGVQLMQMEARGFEYMPKEITIRKDIPVRWEIYNTNAVGCANAVYAPDFHQDVILLKPGLNVVNFTPTKAGTFKITCSMGMVAPVYVSVK